MVSFRIVNPLQGLKTVCFSTYKNSSKNIWKFKTNSIIFVSDLQTKIIIVMYNAKQIKTFLDKVNKEAEQAAQAVYDKHEAEFIQRVKNQIPVGTTLRFGMGSGYVYKNGVTDYDLSDSTFVVELADQLQYNTIRASFDVFEINK